VMNCHGTQVSSRSYIDLQMTATRLLGLSVGVEHAMGLYANDPLRLDALSDIMLSSRNF
jgi:hypothetical protein